MVNGGGMTEDEKQLSLFKYDLTFIKFMRTNVYNGELEKMTANGVAVMMCLRAMAPIDATKSYPSIPTLMKLTGIGRKGVMAALKRLCELKYIQKRKLGRKNVYDLLEKIQLDSTDEEARDSLVATVPYGAYETRKHYPALKKFADTGELMKGSPIVINNLNLTINHAANGSNAVFINAQELDSLPSGFYKEAVERILGLVPGAIEAKSITPVELEDKE